jgi:hypothetical protein
MPCKPFVLWNPIPAGSQVCAKVSSPGDDFIARVVIMDADGASTSFGTVALLNGPVCFPLEQRGYGITGTVSIGDEAPTVTLEVMVKGPDGTQLFDCDWEFSTANTTSNINIALVPA